MNFKQVSSYLQSHSLIFHMWEYNIAHNITISLKHTELQPQREGDMAIIALAQQKYIIKRDMISIQRIRMKIGVVHLSNICTADGRKMDRTFYSTSVDPIRRNNYD